MSLKPRKWTPTEPVAHEAGRDIGPEILQSLKDMKACKGQVALSSATEAHVVRGLAQSECSRLLDMSVRTLKGWEQGRKQPSGVARTLLAIAKANPKPILAGSAQQGQMKLATKRASPSTRPLAARDWLMAWEHEHRLGSGLHHQSLGPGPLFRPQQDALLRSTLFGVQTG